MRGTSLLLASLLAVSLAAGGCAYVAGGAVGAYLLVESQDDNPPPVNYAPLASGTSPGGTYPVLVSLSYGLIDANGDPCDVDVEFTADSGSSWHACAEYTAGASEGTSGLSASAAGSAHVFEWDIAADANLAVYGFNVSVLMRVTPRESGGGQAGTAWTTNVFTVRYNAVPVTVVSTPAGIQKMAVDLAYTITDAEVNTASVLVEYSTTSATAGFAAATAASGSNPAVALVTGSSPPGPAYTFSWDSLADLGFANQSVWLRVTATDETTSLAGTPSVTSPFQVNNEIMEVVVSTGEGDFSLPHGVAFDAAGNAYVADTFRSQIRVVNLGSTTLSVAGVLVAPSAIGVIAGTGVPGYNGDDRLATTAQLDWPYGLAVDQATGDIYVADTNNHRIRRIDASTGFITTVAGDGTAGTADNDLATACQLDGPRGVALDSSSPPTIYVADTDNHSLRCVNQGSASVSVAGLSVSPSYMRAFSGTGFASGRSNGLAGSATWDTPWGIVRDGAGRIFVADSGNHWVRVVNDTGASTDVGNVTIPSNEVDVVAGDPAPVAPTSGYAGEGVSSVDSTVRLDRPAGLCLNPGGHLVFADSNNACVRAVNVNAPGGGSLVVGLVTVAEGDIRTVAGNGAAGTDDNVAATSATPGILDRPRGLASDSAGNLFVADSLNNRLMVVNASAGSSTTQAGVTVAAGYIRAVKGQPGVHAAVEPRGCCVHNNVLYMADAQSCRIVAKDLATGALSVVAGSGARGSADGPLLSATFDGPTDVKMEAGGRFLVVCDSNNSAVRVVNVSGNVISAYTIFSLPAGQVGTVDTSGSPLAVPMSLALETDGTPSCFVADTGNHRVVLLDYMTGSMTPIAGTLGSSGFAGDSGAATSCNLDSPVGVAIDSSYNVFVADTANHAVRLVNRSASVIAFGTVTVNPGEIETIAGFPPPSAQSGYDGDNKPALYSLLDSPTHLLVDGSGHVYFCDERNHRIRTLNATTGLIDTVAGTGTLGYNGDGLPPLNSWISSPSGLALSGGVLYFSDTGNAIVRRFKP